LGATVATATAGPFAASLGRPRDLAIGLECVDGTGRVVRAGGRVVKNVAGFDLVRLMTGQWGTLGVITAVDLRLRARPAVDETLVLTLRDATGGGTRGDVAADPPAERLRRLVRGPYAPLACVDRGRGRWLLRLGGNATFVRAATAAFSALGSVEPRAAGDWDDVRRELAPAPRLGAWRWDALARRIKERFDPGNVLNPWLRGEATGERVA
jgi:glycolate oxidase FAD binding subunit